jgi:MFS family permease
MRKRHRFQNAKKISREVNMRIRLKATHVVLAMLCAMYFITYIDRVNIGTAASEIQKELHLSNTELGFVFSAFAYPYLLFQVTGGWLGDRLGARKTLFICGVVWAASTIMTGFVQSLTTLVIARLALGLGEGATFPVATRAMQHWTPAANRGFAQGLTHAFARLGNAITPPLIALLMFYLTWRGSFVVVGCISLFWGTVWYLYFRNDPKEHRSITAEELEQLPIRSPAVTHSVPWLPLVKRMWPVTLTYFCYGWSLWLYLNWLPLFFKNNYNLDIKRSAIFASGVFFAGVLGDSLGGLISDRILKRSRSIRLARLSVIFIGFVGALLCLFPILFIRDINIVALCLSGGFFCGELVIGPMWSIPMDIAPKYSGSAAGLMNTGSAFAAIVSPLVAGYVIDVTGNWYLPFLMSMGLLLLGAGCTFLMRPEKPFEEPVRSGSELQVAAAVK